jgi:uncharacterized protein YndB with AHSA1/START domain
MTETAPLDAYGALIEPTTLRIQRLLPGPIERVWAYLTESELRRQWLASGDMEMKVGSTFDLEWRNNELTDPPGRLPEGFDGHHSLTSRITELVPQRRLGIEWGSSAGVVFDLEPMGDEVMLTITHKRAPDRSVLVNVSAGWHAHLDILSARLGHLKPGPFWDRWTALKADYEGRIPA